MRFLIADDHPIIRSGMRQLIAQEWPTAHIEEADNIEAAERKARDQVRDLIVLDLANPDDPDTDSATRMLRVAGSAPILIVSFNDESAYAARLLQMGVSGYLPKDRTGAELVTAMRRLCEGKRYVTPSMADQILDAPGKRADLIEPHENLSTQEHGVMLLIAAGQPAPKIARKVRLSVREVGACRARILEKTGWKNNIELTNYCVQHGLIEG